MVDYLRVHDIGASLSNHVCVGGLAGIYFQPIRAKDVDGLMDALPCSLSGLNCHRLD